MPAQKKGFEVEVETEAEKTLPVDPLVTPLQNETASVVEPAVSPSEPIPATRTAPLPPVNEPSQIFGPAPAEPPPSSKGKFWVLIILFTLLGAIAGAVGIYLQKREGFSSLLPSSSPLSIPQDLTVPSPTPETSPTPKPKLDRSKIRLQVLNGSGVTGAAALAREYLEDLGYTVTNVGNAASSDYPSTQILLKEIFAEYAELLTDDLASKYSVSDQIETLSQDSSYDAVVILGSK